MSPSRASTLLSPKCLIADSCGIKRVSTMRYETKGVLSVLKQVIRFVHQVNTKSKGRKRKLWKRAAAKFLYISTSLFIRLMTAVIDHTKDDPGFVDVTALKVSAGDGQVKETIDNLTSFVNENICYRPMDSWLRPSHVLRLGIGDCKNQAALLQAMLRSYGIESELVVGLTNRLSGTPVIHAWVRVEIAGSSLICDPVVSGKAMDVLEYENEVKGLIDITPEYLLKEPLSAAFGVGEISYPVMAFDKNGQSHSTSGAVDAR